MWEAKQGRMYTIGQFSIITRLPAKTLRYYDEIGLLKPARVDEASGYRYYGPEEITQAATVNLFRDLDFSLTEVAELVGLARNGDLGDLAERLRRQEQVVVERKARYDTLLARLHTLARDVEKEAVMSAIEVSEKQIEDQMALTVRKTGPYSELGAMIGSLFQFAGMNQLTPAGAPMWICHDKGYQPEDADLEAAVPVTGDTAQVEAVVRARGGPVGEEAVEDPGNRGKVGIRSLPGGRALSATHTGAFDTVGPVYQALMDAAEQRGLAVAGPTREIYLVGPGPSTAPREPVTEVVLPVK